jgi:hypothetical protein
MGELDLWMMSLNICSPKGCANLFIILSKCNLGWLYKMLLEFTLIIIVASNQPIPLFITFSE